MIIFCISTPDILSVLRKLTSENATISKEINSANAISLTALTSDRMGRGYFMLFHKIKERVKRKIYVKMSDRDAVRDSALRGNDVLFGVYK